jgi:hypothetical protein
MQFGKGTTPLSILTAGRVCPGALSHLREADTLVVWKLDRLGCSVKRLVDLVNELERVRARAPGAKAHTGALPANRAGSAANGRVEGMQSRLTRMKKHHHSFASRPTEHRIYDHRATTPGRRKKDFKKADVYLSIMACRSSDVIYALISGAEIFPMNQLRNFLHPILLLLILSEAAPRLVAQNEGAEKVKEPVQARIEPKHRTDPSFVVGDVIVTYRDGTTDFWTLKGNCMDPKVSAQGQVGWVLCEFAADGKSLKLNDNVPIGSQLVICYRGKVIAKLRAAKPFIEEWAFSDDDQHVIVKSRAAHGPASIELFGLHSGPAEASVAAFEQNLPDWARPFRDR